MMNPEAASFAPSKLALTIPRELFPGLPISALQYQLGVVTLTAISSVLLAVAVTGDEWDRIKYDKKERLKAVGSAINETTANWMFSKFNGPTGDKSESELNRMYLDSERKAMKQRFYLDDGDFDGLLVWDFEATCANTAKGLRAWILVEEHSGVWKTCRDYAEGDNIDIQLQEACAHRRTPLAKCLNTQHRDTLLDSGMASFCCGGCCPYTTQIRMERRDSNNQTTHEAIYTIISATYVSLILQGIVYLLVLVGLKTTDATVVRLTGVLVLMSGVFLGFALMLNQYKIYLMNNKSRSIPYVPDEICQIRTVYTGWNSAVGWGASFASIVASCFWIQLSRFLVQVELSKPPKAIKRKSSANTTPQKLLHRNHIGSANPNTAVTMSNKSKYTNGTPQIKVQQL